MFGLQPLHLIVILIVALLLFGPSRLPEIGKALGKTIREFQSGIKESSQALQDGMKVDETKKEEPPKAP